MAKRVKVKNKKTVLISLVSTANTGSFYVKKVKKLRPAKLALNKYDKSLKKHVLFKEAKIK